VAPKASSLTVKIADQNGMARESDLVRGLQWVYDQRSDQRIRVVNLSMTAATPSSYKTSPLAAAVEQLWLNGVVVVVAAGNRGGVADAMHYAPANDPFVITIGALDHNGTVDTRDDSLATFSGRGTTLDGHAKPEIVAPGRKIVAPLAAGSTLAGQFPERIVDREYIRLSGTSMAAPVVAGVAALLLERYPSLTPNQVKWLLTQTANPYPGKADGAGVVDPVEALQLAAKGSVGQANQGLTPNSRLDSTTNSVVGGQAYWDQAYWDSAYWDQAYWDQAYWNSAYWNQSATFDSSTVD
jgi:serine protease AprX